MRKRLNEEVNYDELVRLFHEFMSNEYPYVKKSGDTYIMEIYADYSDEIDEKTVVEALSTNDPLFEITDKIMESYEYGMYDSDNLEREFAVWLDKQGYEDEYDTSDIIDVVRDYVEWTIDYDHFFGQRMRSVLAIDTGDSEQDFTYNPNYSWDDYDEDGADKAGSLNPKASIVWLAKTQGYSIDDVKEALKGNYGNSKFLESVYNEAMNATSEMNTLVFLLDATVEDLCKVKQDSLGVKVGTNVTCGFFDSWNGAGSILEIALEKPVTIPHSIIYGFAPDVRYNSFFHYSIDDVYGLVGSAYSDDYSLVGSSKNESRSKCKSRKRIAESTRRHNARKYYRH